MVILALGLALHDIFNNQFEETNSHIPEHVQNSLFDFHVHEQLCYNAEDLLMGFESLYDPDIFISLCRSLIILTD